MAASSSQQITQLLIAWSDGDRTALDKLVPLVYDELRRLARHHMRNERAGHTLQTTALIHEAYIRLVDHKKIRWQNRTHFFAIAARIMRRILIDYARGRQRAKRGGGAIKVSLDAAAASSSSDILEIIALDEALTRLEAIDPRKSRVVEMRLFAGLSNEEMAEALDVSLNTIMRDWSFAEAWLRCELSNTL